MAKRSLRVVLFALLFALLAGFLFGTWLRVRFERPVTYLGSALPADPLHVRNAGAAVLDARHDEQQIG